MATITLKNIPADLHRELKKRAKEHHRSLNGEILAILKKTDAARVLDAAALETSVRHARAVFRRPVAEREINAWKRAGRM